ncbi:hypothetical protein QJS10_CPA10g00088 [Acorus calamus]|uniref:Uncharacterized protein n=1 Tax=Acorus calamus TaxID=4465 RepID=A0AAV9DZB9_ACOCL|nr:hypothetical protein QJS10_CPA10g00088 [Acorus calamus]
MIGGFDDAADKVYDDDESTERSNAYSLPLCSKIIKSLQISQEISHANCLHPWAQYKKRCW